MKENLLLPLDKSKLPNLKNIGPEYWKQPHDPELSYSVPYMQGTVGIVVNTEKVKEPVTGYARRLPAEVQGPHRGPRRRARDRDLGARDARGSGRTRVTEENLEKVRPVLAAWLPLVKVYDSDSPKTALLNGDVDLGIVWSGEAAILIKEQPGSSSTCCRRKARTCSSTTSRSRRARRARRRRAPVHRLHPAARRQQADLGGVPVHEPEPRGAQAAEPGGAGEPGQLSARQSRSSRPSATSGRWRLPVDKLFTDLKAKSGA